VGFKSFSFARGERGQPKDSIEGEITTKGFPADNGLLRIRNTQGWKGKPGDSDKGEALGRGKSRSLFFGPRKSRGRRVRATITHTRPQKED